MWLLFVSLLKMLVEMALMLGLAQSLLALLLGAGHAGNPVFRLLQGLTQPWRQFIRFVWPGAQERLVQRWYWLSLGLLWLGCAVAKVSLYRDCQRWALCG